MKLAILTLPLAACTTVPAHLQQVNTRVNHNITYMSDQVQYGEPDRWVANPTSGKGDCEDYALTKQEIVGGQVLACNLYGTWHAVLVVDGWVLDNLRDNPVPAKYYDCQQWLPVSKPKHEGK